MSSTKFDSLSVDFSKAIGDTVASANANGSKLDATERNSIINRALAALFNQKWEEVKGKVDDFLDIFPELQRDITITTNSNGKYTIGVLANLDFDFYTLIDGRKETGDVYISLMKPSLYQTIKSSSLEDFEPTDSEPMVFEKNGVLEFLPDSEYDTQNVNISYIQFPRNPSDGSDFTAVGTYDSPFHASWHDRIINIAKAIYLDMVQEK